MINQNLKEMYLKSQVSTFDNAMQYLTVDMYLKYGIIFTVQMSPDLWMIIDEQHFVAFKGDCPSRLYAFSTLGNYATKFVSVMGTF